MEYTLELSLPIYYVVSRELPVEQAPFILKALSITPIVGVIISSVLDAQLAFSMADEVIRVHSDNEAHLLAQKLSKELNQPLLVVSEAGLLDAVFEDGKREPVATVC